MFYKFKEKLIGIEETIRKIHGKLIMDVSWHTESQLKELNEIRSWFEEIKTLTLQTDEILVEIDGCFYITTLQEIYREIMT